MEKEKMTPMMSQYLATKEEYKDCILFYRLGDFYEMFFEDAKICSRELEIALTGKACGLPERAPMCGVPHHSADSYIAKLIEKGYKVAICEQTEDPKLTKGIVKREVVRILTPGTLTEDNMLDDKKNNYLAVIFKAGNLVSLAFSDISTGEVYATKTENADDVISEIARYAPSEILVNDEAENTFKKIILQRFKTNIERANDELFEIFSKEEIKKQFDKSDIDDEILPSVSGLLAYVNHTQKQSAKYIDNLEIYEVSWYMEIDPATRRNLEITETMRDKYKKGSLLWILDKSKTSMGARLIKQWVEKPLVNQSEIRQRLEAVEELFSKPILRDDLRQILSGIYDIARIVSRISLFTVSPQELVSLKLSLEKIPDFKNEMLKTKSKILSQLGKDIDILEDVKLLIEDAISDYLTEGDIIKGGYNSELDSLRLIQREGRSYITRAEAEEREKTGIKNLKIGYNKVFGYYIEISNSNKDLVPENYIRKQTLVNGERYITPELKEMENTILGAGEKIDAIQKAIFKNIVERIEWETPRLKNLCYIISVTDALSSFAEVAFLNDYKMPEIVSTGEIEIKEGRHPVVEKNLPDTVFVPNDTQLNSSDSRLMLITGPNMAGKSTYMRQVALITLMAQVGSFVPVEYAKITPVDRIFTRVGASDDIGAGQSTFMVEMVEVAQILKYSTKNSLVILDEIGRGTSTFDGLSIAWAVAEYMQDKKKSGAKTLFATHYHEMCELENEFEGIKNYSVAVKKRGEDITFLRRIVRGPASDSYGIEVAALAGIPGEVIKRAKEILKKVENDEIVTPPKQEDRFIDEQIDFADLASREIVEELKMIDATTFTPIEAISKLYELSKKAKEL